MGCSGSSTAAAGATVSAKLSAIDRERIAEILLFWFGPTFDRGLNTPAGPEQYKRWFGTGDDAEIVTKFKTDLENLVAGKYAHWQSDKDGRLASIILID